MGTKLNTLPTLAVAAAMVAGLTAAGSAILSADSADSADAAEKTLVDIAWEEVAASHGGKCVVDRIAKEWEAAGKPKVKGWSDDVEDEEAEAAYNCIKDKLAAAYGKSDEEGAKDYQSWKRYNITAYQSGTHGNRFVNNFANDVGSAYGKYEESGEMPVGTVLLKDSFGVNKKGQVKRGPLFSMIKMEKGFNEKSGDWRYALIQPNGKVMGATGGKNSKKMNFCIKCHIEVADQDSMFFLPEDLRVE